MSLKCHLKWSERIAITSYRKYRVQMKSLDLIDFPIFFSLQWLFFIYLEKNILKSEVDSPVYYKRHFYGGEYIF